MQESQVNFLSCSNQSIKGMDLFNKKTTSNLSDLNNYEFDELRQFLRLSKNIEKNNNNTGAENFPGEMLTPRQLSVKLDDDFSSIDSSALKKLILLIATNYYRYKLIISLKIFII